MSRRTGSSSATSVEVVFLPNLKNCLLNLPASLVAMLLNSNATVQNVIVELQYRPPTASAGSAKTSQAMLQSAYFGWTGMQSQTKVGSLVGRDGVRGRQEDQHTATVEVDATFARRLGLGEGMKVRARKRLGENGERRCADDCVGECVVTSRPAASA